MSTQDEKTAENRLQAGIDAFYAGKLDMAAEVFSDAEIRFRLLGDFKRAGDSRSMLADVQRQNNLLEQAANSYQRAHFHWATLNDNWHILTALRRLTKMPGISIQARAIYRDRVMWRWH